MGQKRAKMTERHHGGWRETVGSLAIIVVVMLVPIVPFLFFGQQLERGMATFLANDRTAGWTAGAVIVLLSTDVFLPVPSSVLATIAGARLGWLAGTLSVWVGLNAGALLGFLVARRWGRAWVLRLMNEEQLASETEWSDRHGPWLLVVTRGIPIVAEAMVLWAGIHRLAWLRFLAPVGLSNLGIAVAYAKLGESAAAAEWLPAALGVAAAVPLALLPLFRWWLRRRQMTRPAC